MLKNHVLLVGIVLAIIAAAGVSAVVVSSHSHRQELGKEAYRRAKEEGRLTTRRFSKAPRAAKTGGADRDTYTQPPLIEPTGGQILMIDNFCTQELFLLEGETYMSAGAFLQAPPSSIPSTTSGSLIGVPFVGSAVTSGAAVYFSEDTNVVIEVGFDMSAGEWGASVSYPTISKVALVGEVQIGDSARAFYGIVIGNYSYPFAC